MLRLKSS